MLPIRYKVCVVCGIRSGSTGKQKRKFMAKFPFEQERCKQWVKVIGNEDLALIPIEKLYQSKYVCGDHFQHKDFNRNQNRLKTWAIPSVGINAQPLSDHSLIDFPYHISKDVSVPVLVPVTAMDIGILPIKTSNESEPKNEEAGAKRAVGDVQPKGAVLQQLLKPVDDVIQSVGYQTQHNDETSEIIEETFCDDDFLQSNEEHSCEPTFSWQKDSAAVACETLTEVIDKDLLMQCDETDELYMYPEAGASSAGTQDRKDAVPDIGDLKQDYKCNLCSGAINGPRYTCVQCVDFDLCATCEARGAHALHYVLRVPAHRTHNEVFAVLQTLRRILVTDSVIQMDSATVDELKVEVKEEVVDPIYVEQMTSPAAGDTSGKRGEDEETKVAGPLEEDIETGVADPLEEDVEMLEEYLDSEPESSHSNAHGTRTSYMEIVPKPSEPLYMVVGLDNQRQLDVRLSKDTMPRELRNMLSGLSSTSQNKPNTVKHRKLNMAKTNTQTRYIKQTTQTRPIYHHANPRPSSSTEALHRKFSPVQVYSYNVQNTDVSQAGISRVLNLDSSLGKSSRPAKILATLKDGVISAVKVTCAGEIPNILHKNTDVRQENAPAMVPRVVLEDVCATRKS